MLSRANKAYEANPPPRNNLAKTLFPSSSPNNNNNNNGSSQNANIEDSFKRPSQQQSRSATTAASVSARNDTASAHANMNTNTNRNANAQRSANPSHTSQSSAHPSNHRTPSMTALYSQSNSFREAPDDLVYSGSQLKTDFDVLINEDDFSDDETLLDHKQPSALPPPTKSESLPEPRDPSFPDSTQPVPWSSSPASHMAPPPTRTISSCTASDASSAKRNSHQALGTVQPPAKKRSLPKDWKKPEHVDLENAEEVSRWANGGVPPPTRKNQPKPYDPLDAVGVSQMKKQSKKPSDSESVNADARQATATGMEKNAASSKGISLSKEQQRVLDLVVNHQNSVFFTGPAGTGKSVLMRSIISALKKKFARDPERLAVTASTGLAACNIGGITLHSFSGIGLGKDDADALHRKVRRNPKASNRWLKTKVLIIDEISMVDGELFDKLEAIGRRIRKDMRPWGGIQLVITGDFFQLPPVPDFGRDQKKKEAKFAFDAATWNTSIDHTIGLTQVFRQKDPVFANMLNEMRLGRINDETVKTFKSLCRPIQSDSELDLETTELFPTRSEVERANQSRLRSLEGKQRCFEAFDAGDPAIKDKLLQNMMAPPSLPLKVGAQVMLIKNMDDTLVNGTLGKVKGFMTEAKFESLQLGQVSDTLGSNVNGSINSIKKETREELFSWKYEEAKKAKKDGPEYPWVEFEASDGRCRSILCTPEDWKVELPTGEVQASRSQVPLILAWALSIHKAQGQTLERVKVDLGKVFEKGQAYVALSRATSQQGLQVMRFEKQKVVAHPRVVDFYNKLYSIDQAEAVSKTKALALSKGANGKGNKQPPGQLKIKGQPQMKSFLQKKPKGGASTDEMDEERMMMEAHG